MTKQSTIAMEGIELKSYEDLVSQTAYRIKTRYVLKNEVRYYSLDNADDLSSILNMTKDSIDFCTSEINPNIPTYGDYFIGSDNGMFSYFINIANIT